MHQPPNKDGQLPFTLKGLVRHSPAVLGAVDQVRQATPTPWDTIGGVIRNGQLAYMTSGSLLEVIAVRTGVRVANYNFESFLNTGCLNISCVDEVEIPEVNACVLAVGLQSDRQDGIICLFAVQGTRILRVIDVPHRITSCCFVGGARICARSDLKLFDGCLAVGTDVGKVVLFDLCITRCQEVLVGTRKLPSGDSLICLSNENWGVVKKKHKRVIADGLNFGIQLKFLENSGAVLSMLSLQPLLSIAVGLSDGLLIHYTLNGLEGFHISQPPEPDWPIVKMSFIEPANDPRACLYIWTFHSTPKAAVAVMHSITYRNKVPVHGKTTQPDHHHVYDEFLSSTPRLTMPIFDVCETIPIACQAVSKQISDEDDALSLCVLSWRRSAEVDTQVCVFDLNQWYKEQMPDSCDWRKANSFLAVFPLQGLEALDVWMDAATVTPFSSIQRPEEHFWPASLNFECIALTNAENCRLHWPGLQNQALQMLCKNGTQVFLDPYQCFDIMVRASLLPQFCEYNPRMQLSINTVRDILLSVALENNCVALLRDCGRVWADGSHVGSQPQDGLSLSTLTDWIWKRAGVIKDNCNQMCVCLFDHSGTPIDQRAQKRLLHCARQLKTLADLMSSLIATFNRFIPSEVMTMLQSQRNSIRMAHEYQEVLQWLLNMGLLPEGSPTQSRSFGHFVAIPYPYRVLRQFYAAQRLKFGTIDAQLLNSKRSCRIMYIDSLIERKCNPACLRSEWRKDAGDGLYPPPSLQAMLRTLLVPGVDVELKYTLFVYLFLDLSVAFEDEQYEGIVQKLIKFPAVFKLNPALIKTTQAFWNLDHGHFETAIEELISPMSQDRHLAHWQQEILIETLLVQDVPHLALRALRAPGPPIAPLLEIRTLLANNLVAEAFQLQRSKADDSLMREFFKTCHSQHKWHYVLDLSLNSAEEETLGTFLRTTDSTLTSNLHFVYLLQRSKYIEAISYVDDLHHNRRRRKPDLDTPNTIVAAYKLTMTPATRTISDVYYSLRDNIDTKLNQKAINPYPLSTKLLQRKLDLVGGIYHRTVLSAEQTTSAYWFGQPNKRCNLTPNNVPFLRNPQYDVQELAHKQHLHHNTGLSYASVYAGSNKRNLNESVLDAQERRDQEKDEGPRKRRRIEPNEDNLPILSSKTTRTIETTLSTPIVNSTEKTPPKSTLLYTAVTPQSILKIPGSPARSIRMRSLSPISAETDDRLIRFNLPANQDDFRAATPVATSTILSPQAALDFTEDDDVSPNASDNKTSPEKQEEAAEVITPPENQKEKILLDYSNQESPLQRRLAVIDGPKARKRIHDGCGEGDVPVVVDTPPPVRRSIRSRSKTPDVEIVPKPYSNASGSKHSLQNNQRKPLSRMVLEANAKKIIESTDSLLAATKAKATASVSDMSLNNTTIDSLDTTVYERVFSDNSDLCASFMDRWNAERNMANSSVNSSVNDGTSFFEQHSLFSDSDASFAGADASQPSHLIASKVSQKSPQENAEEVVIIDDTNAANTAQDVMVIAEKKTDDVDNDDSGSMSINVSVNSDSESEENLVSSESETHDTAAELLPSGDDSDESMSNDGDDDADDDDDDINAIDSDESLASLQNHSNDPPAAAHQISEVINITSSSEDEMEDEDPDDGGNIASNSSTSDSDEINIVLNTQTSENDYGEEFALVEDEVVSADREYNSQQQEMDDELLQEPIYANLEQVPIEHPMSDNKSFNQLNTPDSSWQGLQTAECSLVENLDEAQIMESIGETASILTEHTSSGLSELNHAIIRETDEEMVEVAEATDNPTVTVSESFDILDQGLLLEDTGAVSTSTKVEEPEQPMDADQIMEEPTANVKVAKSCDPDDSIVMSPLVMEASQLSDLDRVQYIGNTNSNANEADILLKVATEKQPTPIEATELSPDFKITTPIPTRLARVTRARSGSLEEQSDASPLPIAITPRRSSRAKSITQMDIVASPSTPVTNRRTRGASEPKQASNTPITAVRRLLESNTQRITPDVVELTPKRRNVRRTSQTQVLAEEETLGTPTRRSRRTSQNTSPIADPNVTMVNTPRRLTTRSRQAQQFSPNDENDETASIKSGASKMSVNSSITTRSQTAAAHHSLEMDDDEVSLKSVKSTRSTVSTATKRAAAAARAQALPAIDEIKESEETDNTTTYSESRRLTRHQISIMDRIKNTSISTPQTPSKPSTPPRKTRAQSSGRGAYDSDNDQSDDTRSNRSGRSTRNTAKSVAKPQTAGSPTKSNVSNDDTEAGVTPTKGSGSSRPRRNTRRPSTSSKT